MNGSDDTPNRVDELVRSCLEGQIARLDTSALRSRIAVGLEASASLADSAPAASTVPRRTRKRTLTYLLATATGLVIAFLGGRYFDPASASAATVLQSVRDVHAQPVDRCYQVHYVPDSRYWDGKNTLLGPSQSLLWTRGDRFFADCRIGDLSLAIGRDADGLLWVGSSRKKGLVFEGSDVSLSGDLATLCDINTMSLSKLVDDVLADFDFKIEQRDVSRRTSKTVIWAHPKADRKHRLISAAVIEVDESTNAIERLVLWMLRDGRPNGTVTYTWTETSRRPDAFYVMQSHFDADAVIEVKKPDGGSSTVSETTNETDATPAQRTPR